MKTWKYWLVSLLILLSNNIIQAQKIDNQIFFIINKHSNKAIYMPTWNTNNGSSAIQWDWNKGEAQKFLFQPDGHGNYYIINQHSKKALDVAAGNTADHTNIQQWQLHKGSNQKFKLQDAGDGYYFIINIHSDKAVEVASWSKDNKGNIQQYKLHGGNNQKFKLVKASAPKPKIVQQTGDVIFKVTFESIECPMVDEIDDEADIIGMIEIYLKNEKLNQHIYPYDGNNKANTVFNSNQEKDFVALVPEGSKKTFDRYKYYHVKAADLPYAKLHIKGTLAERDGTNIPFVKIAHIFLNGNDNLGSHDLIVPLKNVKKMVTVGGVKNQSVLETNYSVGPIYSDTHSQRAYINVRIEPFFK